jgi:hypothetical protein
MSEELSSNRLHLFFGGITKAFSKLFAICVSYLLKELNKVFALFVNTNFKKSTYNCVALNMCLNRILNVKN